MDVSGSHIELPEDRITRMKKELLEINIAELQHLINHIQKERDDLLVAVSFTHSFFTMDVPHFKEFKTWLQAEGIIDMDAVVLDAISSIPKVVEAADGPQGASPEEEEQVESRRLTGPPPPADAAGWGC